MASAGSVNTGFRRPEDARFRRHSRQQHRAGVRHDDLYRIGARCRLRLRRISPAMLARKLKSKSKVAVLDLLDFEDETGSQSLEAIPSAFRVDPSRLRKSPHITIPNDVEIILYSSSGGEIVSARAAMALRRIGVEKVWILDGGLKAWREP